MKTVFLSSTVALMLMISSVATSSPPGWGVKAGPEGGMGMLGYMADEIGLTLEQENTINQLIDTSKLDNAVDRERMSQLRDGLRSLSQADDVFDASAASVLADELSAIVARSAVSKAELHWQIRQVLSAEQRQLIEQHRAGRRDKRMNFERDSMSM